MTPGVPSRPRGPRGGEGWHPEEPVTTFGTTRHPHLPVTSTPADRDRHSCLLVSLRSLCAVGRVAAMSKDDHSRSCVVPFAFAVTTQCLPIFFTLTCTVRDHNDIKQKISAAQAKRGLKGGSGTFDNRVRTPPSTGVRHDGAVRRR